VRRRPFAAVAAALAALVGPSVVLAAATDGRGPAPSGDTSVHVQAVPRSDPNGIDAERSKIDWHPSFAVGEPNDGRLVNGVQLPPSGADYVTWDPIFKRRPNRGWRRWGTDHLLQVFLRVAHRFRELHRSCPRLVVGDISRRHGGDFGPQFGGVGHASHQNGLDIDIYYPRLDRRLRAPTRVDQIDLRLAQELVRAFVAVGPQYIFVGPHTGLVGPPKIVQPLRLHDDHMHVRLYNPLGSAR
jgi:murein endopeptidase